MQWIRYSRVYMMFKENTDLTGIVWQKKKCTISLLRPLVTNQLIHIRYLKSSLNHIQFFFFCWLKTSQRSWTLYRHGGGHFGNPESHLYWVFFVFMCVFVCVCGSSWLCLLNFKDTLLFKVSMRHTSIAISALQVWHKIFSFFFFLPDSKPNFLADWIHLCLGEIV